jgi:hypothetical protein
MLLGGVLLLSIAAGSAPASEVKHAAMAGVQVIPTNSELSAFPWKAINGETFVEITSGVSQFPDRGANRARDGQARAVLKIGRNWAIQLQSNNRVFGDRIASYAWFGSASDPAFETEFLGETFDFLDHRGGLSQFEVIDDGQRFDIDIAGPAGGGGFSIGLSQGAAGVTNEITDFNDTDKFLGFRGSWGNGRSLNLGAEIGFESSERDDFEGDTFTLSALGTFDTGDWILRAAFTGADGVRDLTDTLELDHRVLGFLGGAGRLLMDGKKGQSGADLYLSYLRSDRNDYPGGNANTIQSIFTLPGVRVGFWRSLRSSVKILGGASAEYQAKAKKQEDVAGEKVTDRTQYELDFAWYLGFSLSFVDELDIDLQLHPDGIPYLLSLGNDRALIMVASLTLKL